MLPRNSALLISTRRIADLSSGWSPSIPIDVFVRRRLMTKWRSAALKQSRSPLVLRLYASSEPTRMNRTQNGNTIHTPSSKTTSDRGTTVHWTAVVFVGKSFFRMIQSFRQIAFSTVRIFSDDVTGEHVSAIVFTVLSSASVSHPVDCMIAQWNFSLVLISSDTSRALVLSLFIFDDRDADAARCL